MSISATDTTGNLSVSDPSLPVTLDYLLIETEAFLGQPNATARLFSNGIQKCKAIVTARALNANSEVVNLPDDTQVEVIAYFAGVGWSADSNPPLAGILPFNERLNFTAISQDVLDNGVEEPLHISAPLNFKQFVRYISYAGVPSGTQIQFAAKVTLPGDAPRMFTTNNPDVTYGPVGQNGRFNSSFFLQSVASPNYAGNLIISDPIQVFSGPINGPTAKIYNTYVGLRYPGTTTLVAIHTGSDPDSESSHFHNKATALGKPGSTLARKKIPTNSQLQRNVNEALNVIREPRPDSITVAVGMTSRVTESEYFSEKGTSQCRGLRDVYGNPIALSVTLISKYPQRDPWDYELQINWAG